MTAHQVAGGAQKPEDGDMDCVCQLAHYVISFLFQCVSIAGQEPILYFGTKMPHLIPQGHSNVMVIRFVTSQNQFLVIY